MRKLTFAVALVALTAAALALMPAPGKHSAYASSLRPIPIDPGCDPACSKVCLMGSNGLRYCGTGQGMIGCKSIVNNRCIYVLCPIGGCLPTERVE